MKVSLSPLIARVGWTTAGYGIVQVLRLVTSVALAKILAPELIGVMIIVNTLRTGIELVSDIGVGQNIVSSKNANEPRFYDTAWTVQVIRGFVLAALCLALAAPLATFYENEHLYTVLPAASLFFVIAGVESTARFLVQKRLQIDKLITVEVVVAIISTVGHIALALLLRNIWALLLGGLLVGLSMTIGTYLLIPNMRHRLTLDRSALREIIGFGKWVFLASLLYFAAMNFDRLYLGQAFSLAVLGVYGIARSLADTANLLVARFGTLIIFPAVAASNHVGEQLRKKIGLTRTRVLILAAVAISLFVATSDALVALLYDERYQAAAQMLPVLILGVWLSILCTINESTLLGIGRPAYGAFANAAKLVWLVAAVPIGIERSGIAGAVLAIAAAEAVRYLPLWWSQRREGLSFARIDLLATLIMFSLIFAWRLAFDQAGVTGGVSELWSLPIAVFGGVPSAA